MKKTPQKAPVIINYEWITLEMMAKGITVQSLNYLQNSKIRLRNLQSPEFVYLWKQLGEKFEETRVFKNYLPSFINEARAYDLKWPEFDNKYPAYSELLRKFAPFEMALELCINTWHLFSLAESAGSKGENIAPVFERIIDAYTANTPKANELKNFRKLVEGYPQYEVIADLMIDMYLVRSPGDYGDFVKVMSPRRRNNLARVLLDENKPVSSWRTNIEVALYLLWHTRDQMFVDVVCKLILNQSAGEVTTKNEQKNYYIAYKKLCGNVHELGTSSEKEGYQALILPIVVKIAAYMNGKEDDGHIKMEILELISEIDPQNTSFITDKVVSLLNEEYAYPEYCIKYYKYSEDSKWVDRFCTDLKKFNYVSVGDVLKFFNSTFALTKSSVVLETFIEYRLKNLTTIEDIKTLLEWDAGNKRFGLQKIIVSMLPKLMEDENNRKDLPKILKYL